MKVKLSALALGITFAYGMTAAMAGEASITQTGGFSHATIDQYNNDGSAVSASIVTSGWANEHSIDQTMSNRVWARVNSPGSLNTAVIEQSRLDYGGAHVYQAAGGSTVTINQGAVPNQPATNGKGKGHGHGHGQGNYTPDGSSQWAFVHQNHGWGHDASIIQRGHMVEAKVNQSGYGHEARVDQRGAGTTFNKANVNQSGIDQYASVTQNGSNLVANVTQKGIGHVAMVSMSGNSHTATVVQKGWGNTATVNQSN
ncbi:MAG: hypothetical protein GX772_01045 [Alcaligenaceae bacterium]|nr:hypothetical protein [Alcaligenaceae bacterium]